MNGINLDAVIHPWENLCRMYLNDLKSLWDVGFSLKSISVICKQSHTMSILHSKISGVFARIPIISLSQNDTTHFARMIDYYVLHRSLVCYFYFVRFYFIQNKSGWWANAQSLNDSVHTQGEDGADEENLRTKSRICPEAQCIIFGCVFRCEHNRESYLPALFFYLCVIQSISLRVFLYSFRLEYFCA